MRGEKTASKPGMPGIGLGGKGAGMPTPLHTRA